MGSDLSQGTPDRESVMDAIDRMFAEFELVYHNQFHKAFANTEKLNYAKQIWFSHLKELSPERILQATRRVIRESEYLPTVHTLLEHCSAIDVPNAHGAYIEACRAPSPKQAQRWSHPIVYHAGRTSDWHFLASTPESIAFPVFKRNYELLLQRLLDGEALDLPLAKALPETIEQPLSREERKARLRALRDELKI